MLVLSRSVGTAIVIGDEVIIRVLSIVNGDVKFEILVRKITKNRYLNPILSSKNNLCESIAPGFVDTSMP